jgi:Holliday junction DNA helicase RuvB
MNTFIESSFAKEDKVFETPLRPQKLADFIGQDPIKERLQILIQAAKTRGDSLGHCLFAGPPGLGKTTLAHILSREMGTNCVVTSGPALEKPGDLAGILTSLNDGDVLFVDEIHRLQRSIEEYLYTAMEDFVLDLIIDSGPNARTVQLTLKKFTLVAATTRTGLLSEPLRTRFAFTSRLEYYKPDILQQVILRTAQLLKCPIEPKGALLIAERARGTPRIANHLLRWVRDYVLVHEIKHIDPKIVEKALKVLAIDSKGLDDMDKKFLSLIIHNYNGGPVGLSTLSAAFGEESHTIEEVYEPYLIMQGFIKRTPRGRMATELAFKHLEEDPSGK